MASLSTDGKNKSAEKLRDALYGVNSGGRILIASSSISSTNVPDTDASVVTYTSNLPFTLSANDVSLSTSRQFTIPVGESVFYYYLTNSTSDDVFVVSQVTSTATSYTNGGTFSVESLVITVN